MKLKQLMKEVIAGKTCFGCYEDEAYGNASVISSIKQVSKEIDNYIERSSATENEQWHIRYIAFNSDSFLPLVDIIRGGIDDGWYSLLWNDDNIYIIFSNGVAQIKNIGDAVNPTASSTNNSNNLFQKNGLTQEYMDFWLNKALGRFRQIKI